MGLAAGRHIFLSTKEMEGKNKSATLAKALKPHPRKFKTIIIDQNSPPRILTSLRDNIKLAQGEEYVVNITGGTKMMSQMTHAFFAQFINTRIYYWPISEDYVEQVYPKFESIDFPIGRVSLDLKTYFTAYGYDINYSNKLSKHYSESQFLMEETLRFEDSIKVAKIKEAGREDYRKPDKGYYTGGWFEEWFYHTIKTQLKLKEGEIGFNVKIKNHISKKETDSDNEIDIAFIYDNSLCVIECKVFAAKQVGGKRITDAIYKISSIRQSLGLRATAIVAILSPFGDNKQRLINIKDTKRLAGVKEVFSLEDFSDKEKFIMDIKRIVGYE